jgi:hypothetical protein
MVIEDIHEYIECESFKDPETGSLRVRPLPGQGLPTNLVIECSSKERKAHPEGTKFITENVKVCKKTNGRIYLRAKDQKIIKI